MENENITAVAEGKPSGYKVTKKDLRNANWRWLMSVCTFNYQTQQGASVAYALSPVLRKIYTNDEDYKQALNNHFRYYNTQPWLAAIILGACVAMEERDGLAAADAVQDLKIGTMGPLAGVGDSLLMTMTRPSWAPSPPTWPSRATPWELASGSRSSWPSSGSACTPSSSATSRA